MGTKQHPGEGNWRRFWLGTRPELPPKDHLRLLRSGRRDRAGCAPRVALDGGAGRSWGLLYRYRRCTRRHHRRWGCSSRRSSWGPLRRCGAPWRWRRRCWTPSWSMGARWRCLGSSSRRRGRHDLGAEGEEALTSKCRVKTRRHDKQTKGNNKGLHSLGALDLPTTLETGQPLLLLLLLVVVPLGEIAPGRWWWQRTRWLWWLWWRRTRWLWRQRTDAPLRALGLGAGLLGPTSGPLALLGAGLLGPTRGVRKKTIRRHGAADVASLPSTPGRCLRRRSYL
jgi:hypothetical protein